MRKKILSSCHRVDLEKIPSHILVCNLGMILLFGLIVAILIQRFNYDVTQFINIKYVYTENAKNEYTVYGVASKRVLPKSEDMTKAFAILNKRQIPIKIFYLESGGKLIYFQIILSCNEDIALLESGKYISVGITTKENMLIKYMINKNPLKLLSYEKN